MRCTTAGLQVLAVDAHRAQLTRSTAPTGSQQLECSACLHVLLDELLLHLAVHILQLTLLTGHQLARPLQQPGQVLCEITAPSILHEAHKSEHYELPRPLHVQEQICCNCRTSSAWFP